MKRRDFMKGAAALTATAGTGSLSSPLAHADIPALNATVRRLTGDAPLSAGRVKLDLPVLADNGNSVPLQFSLTAPPGRMIAGFEIIAPENPNPVVLRLKLRTALSRYQFSTRIRLAMSQEIWVVSLLDDGSQLGRSLHTVVTDTACFDET